MSLVGHEIERLSTLNIHELRNAWRHRFRTKAPRVGRDLLIRGAAYAYQEERCGGLPPRAARILSAPAADAASRGRLRATFAPGTKIVKEWRGRRYEVIVRKGGFEYAGALYRSLSVIAKKITGSHRSGPAFFGLR